MNRTRNLLIIAAALIVLVAVAALAGRHGEKQVTAQIQTAKYGSFEVKLPENGVVQHPRAATIPTLVSGNLDSIAVHPGDSVSAGELLATVRNPSLESTAAGSEADYSSAVANIDTARVNEQNARVTYEAQVQTAKSNLDETLRVYHADLSLYQNKAIARNQVDADRAKVDQAQVTYDQAVRQLRLGAVTGYGENSVKYAQANAEKARIVNSANQEQLGFTQIRSPFGGIIQNIATQPGDPLTTLRAGDPVTAGQALFTIADSSSYIVKAQVDEQDIINVHPGQLARITSEDFPGKTVTGHVAQISPVAVKSSDTSSTSKQVLTTIRLDASPSFLRDGMSVDVDILTTDIRNALVVPNAAVFKENGRSYVYAVRTGKAVKQQVSVAQRGDTQSIIKSGLNVGDKYIPEKNTDVVDGIPVQAAPSAAPSASP
ncbi:MAG: efflux RND transporter periplasmic adaptor subunit [Candidatus Eremiobacteraeota bacterium]|nr:efflux RND transporter periplasmic adaptor subunit [Candidatus Eremiobacteraeota bacterium]